MHVVLAAVIGLVVGGILGYALRGKEHAALAAADAEAKAIEGDIQKKL